MRATRSSAGRDNAARPHDSQCPQMVQRRTDSRQSRCPGYTIIPFPLFPTPNWTACYYYPSHSASVPFEG